MSAAPELSAAALLAERAHAIRRTVLDTAIRARTCHIGSSLSIVDILTVLLLDLGAGRPDGDRLLLSKGHAALGYYAALAEAGVLDRDEVLVGYCQDGGSLPGHPERGLPGVDITGGSLGHGLSLAIGFAFADRYDRSPRRTFCILGDGELGEGSAWEAFALAGHLRMSSLTAVVDANGLQGLGRTEEVLALEPLPARLETFGWEADEVDGHDHDGLRSALAVTNDRPRAIVARTVKGYGVDFMENELMWHYRTLGEDDRERVMAALERGRAG